MDWRFLQRWIHPLESHAPRSIALAILTPWGQSPATREERATVIRSRCRVIATLFAVLTPAWIAVDALTVGGPEWKQLAAGRVVAALLFAGTAYFASRRTGERAAILSAVSLFAIPIVFFFIRRSCLPALQRPNPEPRRIPPISIFPSSLRRASVFSP